MGGVCLVYFFLFFIYSFLEFLLTELTGLLLGNKIKHISFCYSQSPSKTTRETITFPDPLKHITFSVAHFKESNSELNMYSL